MCETKNFTILTSMLIVSPAKMQLVVNFTFSTNEIISGHKRCTMSLILSFNDVFHCSVCDGLVTILI